MYVARYMLLVRHEGSREERNKAWQGKNGKKRVGGGGGGGNM